MMVSVIGANGRVGSALVAGLATRFDVVPVFRRPDESPAELAARAVEDVDVVVNAAGVAHLGDVTPADLDRLRAANVELPSLLAAAAATERISMIHISSVKATTPGDGAYARSKADGDERLAREWAVEFEQSDSSLVVVRPLALLHPPYHAGKLRLLRHVRRWPSVLTPPVPLPVLTSSAFERAIVEIIDDIARGTMAVGMSIRSFGRGEWGSLRDVRRSLAHVSPTVTA